MSIENGKTYRRGEWFWYPIVRSQQVSGLSQKKFCEQKGVSYASFKNWASRLKNDPTKKMPEIGSFVPAVLASDIAARDLPEAQEAGNLACDTDWNFTPPTNSREEKSDSVADPSSPTFSKSASLYLKDLEIRFAAGAKGKGFGIVVPQGFDELTLHRLLKVVEVHDV